MGRSLHLPKSEIRELYTLKNPAVKYQRVMAYIGVGLGEAPARLDLKELTSGSSVTLMVPYDERVFSGARVIDGIRTAFPIHAYLDLEGVQGSGEEAANRLGEYRDHIVLIGGWVTVMLIGDTVASTSAVWMSTWRWITAPSRKKDTVPGKRRHTSPASRRSAA